MSRSLFAVGKVPMFVDAVSVGIEKRRGGEAKVLKLTLRVDPFDAKLAAAIDEGLGGDTNVRATAFTLSTGEPKPHVERLAMSLDCPRQRMDLYPTPDTDVARIAFDQVKVSGFYVRAQKDSVALTAVLTASFGPFSKEEMEAAVAYFRAQVWGTWVEAEPSMVFDEPDEDDEAGYVERGPIEVIAQSPMWEPAEDQPPAAVVEFARAMREKVIGDDITSVTVSSGGHSVVIAKDSVEAVRPTPKRGTRSKAKRHDPDGERVRQTTAGRAKTARKAAHA